LHRALEDRRRAAPEDAVVHDDRVGLAAHGLLDERERGRDPRHDPAHLGAALDLQPVRAGVLEERDLEQLVEMPDELVAGNGLHSSSVGSPNSMNFIPWKKMLGGYQSAFGWSVARCCASQ